jgi:succinate dehydrogenase / fumarate reductase cytochrome b subunit
MIVRKQRPISPHLSIYKMQLTSALSIAHRATGILLFAGLSLLLWWVICCRWCYIKSYDVSSCDFEILERFKSGFVFSFFSMSVGKLLLALWSYCLFYHLFAGVRYMFFDAGIGFEIKNAYISGWAVVSLSIVTWALVWYIVLT